MVVMVVKPHDHRRVFRKFQQQCPKIPCAVAAEHPYLVVQHFALSDFWITRSEYAVPKQGHLLCEGVCCGYHLVEPVGARIVLAHHT